MQRAVYEPFTSGERGRHVLLDTTGRTTTAIAHIESVLGAAGLASRAPA
jgi:hypothetical protein